MYSRTVLSHSKAYSTSKDVFRSLLAVLIEKKTDCGWAHFEAMRESNDGWLRQILKTKQQIWIEVAYDGMAIFKLNFGNEKAARFVSISIPDKWTPSGDGLRDVPASDIAELVEWLAAYFVAASGNNDCLVKGYLDGL